MPQAGSADFDVWQNSGVYDESVPTGCAIHPMEHRSVWITYDPSLPADEIVTLVDHARSESHLLLTPFPD